MTEENESQEPKGIKEAKELVAAMAVLAKAGFAVAKDGKVDMSDLSHLIALGKDFNVVMEGFKDLDQLMGEVKDLDQAEALELVTLLFAGFNEAKA